MGLLSLGRVGRPVVLYPTAPGRSNENEDFGLTASLADKVNSGAIQLVLPDTVNNESWYNKSVHPAVRVARHVQYDAYLRHELVPYIFNRAHRGDLTVYGESFVAYAEWNFAERHPDGIRRADALLGSSTFHSVSRGSLG